MKVWRLCRERFAASAFSGEGARLASARWNSKGVAMAYGAESLSLAALEVFVHLSAADRPEDLVSIAAEIPADEAEIERHKQDVLKRLTSEWRMSHAQTRALGDAWARSGGSLLMPVPSVIVDGAWNVLVNPEHSDTGKIRVLETKPFRFDPRMFK